MLCKYSPSSPLLVPSARKLTRGSPDPQTSSPDPREERRHRQCEDSANWANGLVEADGLAHGGLDVQRLDVLPVLLEQGHEEVDACEDVD
jgi:hypothetical protein